MNHDSHAVIVRSLFDEETHRQLIEHLNSDSVLACLSSDLGASTYRYSFSRSYAHNLKFLVETHRQLTDFACEVIGEKVKPSYAFLSIYNSKGKCPLHVDRPQCRWTIDYMIEQDVDEPWPIWISEPLTEHERRRDTYEIETEAQAEQVIATHHWASVTLEPNDAVIYSGTHQWHYRRPISGRSCSLAFFHFVPEDFDGPLN